MSKSFLRSTLLSRLINEVQERKCADHVSGELEALVARKGKCKCLRKGTSYLIFQFVNRYQT